MRIENLVRDMNDKELQETIDKLKSLRVTIEEKEKELRALKDHEKNYKLRIQQRRAKETGTRDRDGTPILFGDTVTFLTKGLYESCEGTIYKVAKNKSRITAKDAKGNSISRPPNNVRVVRVKHERR